MKVIIDQEEHMYTFWWDNGTIFRLDQQAELIIIRIRNSNKRQTMRRGETIIYKTLHRKLKIEQNEPTKKTQLIYGLRKVWRYERGNQTS